jgi:hypothetical protein
VYFAGETIAVSEALNSDEIFLILVCFGWQGRITLITRRDLKQVRNFELQLKGVGDSRFCATNRQAHGKKYHASERIVIWGNLFTTFSVEWKRHTRFYNRFVWEFNPSSTLTCLSLC